MATLLVFYTARPNRNGALRRRAGSIIAAAIRASTPWTAIPTMRKGSSRSHTIGYRINATRASGQQTTNRRHQSKNAAMGDPPLLVTDASGKKFIRLPAGDLWKSRFASTSLRAGSPGWAPVRNDKGYKLGLGVGHARLWCANGVGAAGRNHELPLEHGVSFSCRDGRPNREFCDRRPWNAGMIFPIRYSYATV